MNKLQLQAALANVTMVGIIRNAEGHVTYTDPLNVSPEVLAVLDKSDLLHLEMLKREAQKAL